MYNQQFQNSTGRYNNTSYGVGSSNQGMQRTSYQPVGAVQSFYGQSQQQQYGSNPSTEAYHTANYRGNQQGHDQSLRGDSYYPAQQQGGAGNETDYTSFRYGVRGNENAYSSMNDVSSQFGFSSPNSGMNNQMSSRSSSVQGGQGYGASAGLSSNGQSSYAQNPSAEAFHMANYRGNQEGHDQSLRGDSYYPAQQQGGAGNETDYTSFRYGVRGNENAYSSMNDVSSQFGFSSPNSAMNNQMSSRSSSVQGGQGYGASAGLSSNGQSSYAQNPSAEAFHMANYRGNQEGHDQSLRGDSYYPAQQQGGIANSNMDYGSFKYGVRGNENAYNSINNVAPQFGFNSGAYNMSGQSTLR